MRERLTEVVFCLLFVELGTQRVGQYGDGIVVVDLSEVEEGVVVVRAQAKDLTIDLDSMIPVLSEEVDITS